MKDFQFVSLYLRFKTVLVLLFIMRSGGILFIDKLRDVSEGLSIITRYHS